LFSGIIGAKIRGEKNQVRESSAAISYKDVKSNAFETDKKQEYDGSY
jgi:hypothetical protein